MRTTLLLASLTLLSATSWAGGSLSLDKATFTIVRPATGSVNIALTGTITATSDLVLGGYYYSYPSKDADNFLQYDGDQPMITLTNGTYTGDLLYLTVASDSPLGDYKFSDFDPSTNTGSPAYFGVSFQNALDPDDTWNIEANYSVRVVQSVPEPASIASIALGGVGLIRRRRSARSRNA